MEGRISFCLFTRTFVTSLNTTLHKLWVENLWVLLDSSALDQNNVCCVNCAWVDIPVQNIQDKMCDVLPHYLPVMLEEQSEHTIRARHFSWVHLHQSLVNIARRIWPHYPLVHFLRYSGLNEIDNPPLILYSLDLKMSLK